MTQTDEMTFWDHLEELRWVIFRVLGVLVVTTIGTLFVMPYIFDTWVLGPTSSDFFIYRFFSSVMHFDADFKVEIINIQVTSQFMTHISSSFLMACIIAFPYLLFELWRFIRPALYAQEASSVRAAFLFGTVMFYLGCFVGYALIFPFTFRFLAEYQLSTTVVNQINLQSYIQLFTTLIFVMGAVFEMPLLAWLLSCLGLLKREWMQGYRRHAIVILLVLAALITPSGDPFTLSLVFLPLYLLYELSVVVVKK